MRYTFVNYTDYSKENFSSGVMYQLQAIHRTLVYHYNDTLDMIIISKDPMETTVRVCKTDRPISQLQSDFAFCRLFPFLKLKGLIVTMGRTIKIWLGL